MTRLDDLFTHNREWASGRLARDPEFFASKARMQNPRWLWIGCADSRVMANEITGLDAGELFVHRNIANLVVHTDFSCLSVLQFGVEYLGVKDVIVCGHYGCGGVRAAMDTPQLGLADNWLRHIRDVHAAHRAELDSLNDPAARFDRLVELNTLCQVRNVVGTTIVQNAWRRDQELHVHGLVYNIANGLLSDLGISFTGPHQIDDIYRTDPPPV
ncbi:carbonic anhydrase [Candidatus Poribacteria bacterium]|nr:carbonic anhydrase [Candidatus Poribacteria bacterium]